MVDAEIDLAFKALTKELFISHVNRNNIFCLEACRCEILLAVRHELSAQLGIRKNVGPAAAAP